MKEKIKKIFAGMRDHWLLSTFSVSFAASMAAIAVAAIMRGVTLKMIIVYLLNFNLLYVPVVFFVTLTIYLGYLLVRQQWGRLESELKEKTNQYNKLFEKTKPPRSIELIKAEVKCNYGTVRVLDDYLSFDIRVINRTNYLFTAKEVSLACSHDDNCLFDEVWKDWAPTKHIFPSSLEVLEGGNIEFRVPIQKIDNNMRELMLSVKAEYTTEEDIIHDTPRKSVTVESGHLKYRLDEETIQKIERKGGKTNEAR